MAPSPASFASSSSFVVLAATLLAPAVALAQAATPLPPPPPPPPADPQTAPTVIPARPQQQAQQAQPRQQQQPQQQWSAEPAEPRQIRKAENAVFLELGGNGLVYSINYERIFGDSDFSLRVGLSYISVSASSNTSNSSAKASILTFPVLGNYYVGGRDHKLQLGGGLTFISITGTSSNSSTFVSASGFVPAPTLAIGYRYLPARGGFTFFIGLTPFIIPGGDKPIFMWGGMSFGGAF